MVLYVKKLSALALQNDCPTPFKVLVSLQSKGHTIPLIAGTRVTQPDN